MSQGLVPSVCLYSFSVIIVFIQRIIFLIDAVVSSDSENKLTVSFFGLIVFFYWRFLSHCRVILSISKFAYRFLEKLFF